MDDFHLSGRATVRSRDGELGPLMSVVLDPARWTVTYLAVRNGPVPESGRLVPMVDVATADKDGIELQISRHGFFQLPRFIVPELSRGREVPTFAVHEHVPSHQVAVPVEAPVVDCAEHKVGVVSDWVLHPSGALCAIEATGRSGLHVWHALIDAALLKSVETRRVQLHVESSEVRRSTDAPAGEPAR